MKQLKDYLHLYLGCDVLFPKMTAFDEHVLELDLLVLTNFLTVENGIYSKIKPILRPLSDLTEEERSELDLERKLAYECKAVSIAFEIKYLLSKHFDLFGLIPSGIAIDKTTLK